MPEAAQADRAPPTSSGAAPRSYEPHERAALNPQQRAKLQQHKIICICACCNRSRGFDIELGRANELEMGKCAMFGADAFKGHVVSRAVLMAEALLNELGWEERGAIYVPQLHCCAFKDAITGSAARAEAAALQVWRRELDLDAVAKRAVASALLLPFVEPAPEGRDGV